MPVGKVKFFDPKKGWGFITDENGQDVFVHQTNIKTEGFRYLKEKEKVSFDLGPGQNGKIQALDVVPTP